MDEGPLKEALQQCSAGPFFQTDFSIGHRGAALQFPEHTEQSYRAAARAGAGILECDVAVTQDGELVCRHDQCDLHSTTDPDPARVGQSMRNRFIRSAPLLHQSVRARRDQGACGKMDGLTPPSWRTAHRHELRPGKAALEDAGVLRSGRADHRASHVCALRSQEGEIVPSEYARNAKSAKLEIITWTLERSGRLADLAPNSYYYQTITSVVNNDGDMMNVLDVLARQVRILGIFSDWP